MILNTGQRTDIPAFYAAWLAGRLREEFVMVRNPYDPRKITRYLLRPDLVDVIGFCTKNPRPLFPYWELLRPFGQFWYVTINAYGKDLEPNVPPTDEVIRDFCTLSATVGKNAVGWRYTPVIVNRAYTVERHIEAFSYIARRLRGYTSLAVFGFLDLYEKLRRTHPELCDADDAEKEKLTRAFVQIARENGLDLRLCSKEKELARYGVDAGGCMRISDYERSIGKKLAVRQPASGRRGYCACYLSHDIGSYNSCPHLCAYCYANGNREQVLRNVARHDDASPLLIGYPETEDVITDAVQYSEIDRQIALF